MRCALNIAYNGTLFLGSQRQKETPNTILGNLENALTKLGITANVVASGRTDKGVHASSQVCHVDLPSFWEDLEKLKKVLNEILPKAILVNNIKFVNDVQDARISVYSIEGRELIN